MIYYDMPLYRPPSEAYSLIIQATLGCSHNKCAFCSMYTSKVFRARPFKDIREELLFARAHYKSVKRIFIADGDAMVLSMSRLVPILEEINNLFPECERIGIYGTSKSIKNKTDEDLKKLYDLGIKIVYMGLESGDPEVLTMVNKGESPDMIVKAARRIMAAGMKISVTVISGLGGAARQKEHAINSAKALSEMNPDYIGFLALMIDKGTPLEQWYKEGTFVPLTPAQIIDEMILFLSNIDSPNTVFRCNHASNYFLLSGNLNEDIPMMLEELQEAKQNLSLLRDERYRRF